MAGPDSDVDIRGVFIPSERQILLGKVLHNLAPESKDDEVHFSIFRFVELALQGQSVALEMLAAPEEHQLGTSSIWQELVAQQKSFYTKKMKSFVGFAKAQAYKYSLKGERLNDLKVFLAALEQSDSFVRVVADFAEETRQNPQGVTEYKVGSKWYGETTPISNIVESVKSQLSRYGLRSIEAGMSGGKDWKALSHAVRVALQYKQILTEGQMTFPCPEHKTLTQMKRGKFSLPFVQDYLEEIFEDIRGLERDSILPDAPDAGYWEEWLLEIIRVEVNKLFTRLCWKKTGPKNRIPAN
jgi:hypothetical protein